MSTSNRNSESAAATAARAWRTSLPREHRRVTNLRGTWVFLLSGSIYLALFIGIFLAPTWWLCLACLAVMPMAIGAMFVIGHDAAHFALVRSFRLNRILGRLAFLPAYHPFTAWRYVHNVLHHGGTCLKQKQPDFPPLSKHEYDAFPRWRRAVYRLYRTPPGIGLCYLFDFFGRFMFMPNRRNLSPERWAFEADRLLVIAFLVLQIVVGYLLTAYTVDLFVPGLVYAIGGVIVPWLIWIYFMGVVTFVQHTHPRTVWYDDEKEWTFYHVQLTSTTHMVLPRPLGRMLHNIMDHPAHHIDPTIPLYELPASQELLEEQAPEHSIVVPLTLGEFLRICRLCKLYDYRQHRWLDFAGQPTTECIAFAGGR